MVPLDSFFHQGIASLAAVRAPGAFLAAIGSPILPGWADPHNGLRPFIAEMWLVITIIAVLITPFFVRPANRACALVTLAGLCAALVGLCTMHIDDLVIGQRFAGMLVSDPAAILWKILLLIFVIGIVLLWFATTSSSMHEGDGPEFFTLLLGATLGMSLMADTSNLLMLVIAVETASLPSYVLAGFRKTDPIGAEASLKYVLFGAVTSAVMIYGVSLLYGLFGTLQLAGPDGLGARLAATSGQVGVGGAALLVIAIFGVLAGVGFKISAVPFHFWCPDVFEGAGIDVTAFLSVASKGAGLMLLMRVLAALGSAGGNHPGATLHVIAGVVGVIAAVTATVGNTAAFTQTNIKRLLAYSSIAHSGYMLCAVSIIYRVHADSPDPSRLAAQALLLYLAVYLFMNLGAFTVAGLISGQIGSEKIEDYAGLGGRSPVLAACMAVFMFSLVGLPPFAGFVAKWNLMWALIQNGGWWWWLVAVIAVNTVLSLYYYMRIVKVMYLEKSDEPAFAPAGLGSGIAIACAAALVLLLLAFGPLTSLAHRFDRVYLDAPAAVAQAAPSAAVAAVP